MEDLKNLLAVWLARSARYENIANIYGMTGDNLSNKKYNIRAEAIRDCAAELEELIKSNNNLKPKTK